MELLNPQAYIEPLILNWYAWPFLISPQTHCLYILSHLQKMKSFLAAPKIHEQAISSSKFKGGPFLAISAERTSELESLIKHTETASAELLQLAIDIGDFNRFLKAENDFTSLEEKYSKLPKSLRGICELEYDLHHNVAIRFIEKLVYNRYYNPNYQAIKLSISDGAERTFAAGTPRLSSEQDLIINVPFSAPAIDDLARARTVPSNVNELAKKLKLNIEETKKLKNYFIPHNTFVPVLKNNLLSEKVRIRYFGHACVLLSTKNCNIMIDPAVNMQGSNDNTSETFGIYDLPETIDYVLLTHNHQDHVMFETLLQIRHRIKQIIVPGSSSGALQDPSMKYILENIGFTSVKTIGELEQHEIESGMITAIPFLGEHGDLSIRSKAGYHININNKKFVFLADSNNLDPHLYDYIFHDLGDVDVLFIGMECVGAPVSWVYGPLFPDPINRKVDQSRRLNGSDSKKAGAIVSSLKPKKVFVYAMGLEQWMNYILAIDYNNESPAIIESNHFISMCNNIGIPAKRLYLKEECFL